MTEKAGSPPPYEDSQSCFSTGQGMGGYPPQGTGGYPPQGAGGYPPHVAGRYPPQGTGGYPQSTGYTAGEYPLKPQPGPYGQHGYMQPGYSQAYVQHTTQAVIVQQPLIAGHVIVQPRPADYMVASIFACLCCFWPTGLCAIYYASQANALAAQGNMAEAARMSNNARNLMITSIVIGVIWITLAIVFRAVVYSSHYSYNYKH